MKLQFLDWFSFAYNILFLHILIAYHSICLYTFLIVLTYTLAWRICSHLTYIFNNDWYSLLVTFFFGLRLYCIKFKITNESSLSQWKKSIQHTYKACPLCSPVEKFNYFQIELIKIEKYVNENITHCVEHIKGQWQSATLLVSTYLLLGRYYTSKKTMRFGGSWLIANKHIWGKSGAVQFGGTNIYVCIC